jgi:hypothetical protein
VVRGDYRHCWILLLRMQQRCPGRCSFLMGMHPKAKGKCSPLSAGLLEMFRNALGEPFPEMALSLSLSLWDPSAHL